MKFSPWRYSWTLLLIIALSGCGGGDEYSADSAEVRVTEEQGNRSTDENTIFSDEEEDVLKIHFIDAGDGEATLFETKDAVILVDAGQYEEDDVVPYLKEQNISAIDLLVGTNPHSQHIGQFVQVMEEFKIDEIWMSGAEKKSEVYENTVNAILSADINYYEPRAGERFEFGPLLVEVLNPNTITGHLNNDSIAMRVKYGEISFLLKGHLEADVEKEILNREKEIRSTIYKLGSQGSSSSREEFLNEINPEIAVYSAGLINSYNQPHEDGLKRLKQKGVLVYDTLMHGTITIETDGIGYTVYIESEENPVYEVLSLNTDSSSKRSAPCININTASVDELVEIHHIGKERAEHLKSFRPFDVLSDLTKVNGINIGRLNDIKEQAIICEF